MHCAPLNPACRPYRLDPVRRLFSLILPLAFSAASAGLAPSAQPLPQPQALVERALAAELRATQDAAHPMRFQLYKSSPRLTSTKQIVETADGAVARLVAVNGQPLTASQEQAEQARLDALLGDPARQHHRKQREDEDTARALKVLRALPTAFLYRDEGPAGAGGGGEEVFSFTSNPAFNPPDLETQVLTAMVGRLFIDTAHQRVTRLEGRLQSDVDFGWGILGRLNKGGSILITQRDVGRDQWRIVRFEMAMSGRVLFKTRIFDTVEEQTRFAPVPAGLTFQQAIQMLRAAPEAASQGTH